MFLQLLHTAAFEACYRPEIILRHSPKGTVQMASKTRKRFHSVKRAATAGVATATVSALMVGTAPPPTANAAALPVSGASAVPSANTITLAALNDALAVILASNLRSNALAVPA